MKHKTKTTTPRQHRRIQKRQALVTKRQTNGRNAQLYDAWSLLHLAIGIMLGFLLPPYKAFALMVLWEPVEIFLLSPTFKYFGVDFGYETLQNSMSDILIDGVGIVIGALLIAIIRR